MDGQIYYRLIQADKNLELAQQRRASHRPVATLKVLLGSLRAPVVGRPFS